MLGLVNSGSGQAEQLKGFGLSLFAMTVVANFLVLVLGDYLQFKDKSLEKKLKRYKNLAVIAVALCFVFGIFSILAVTGIAVTWWTTLDGIKQWFQNHSDTGMKVSSVIAVSYIILTLFGYRVKE